MSTQIIKNRKIQTNRWRHLTDDEPASAGDITVSLARWLEQKQGLLAREGRIGVRLQPDDAVDQLQSDLHQIGLIALYFSSFTEGRGYSQARLLREQFDFGSEIRALGARRDHLFTMARCGIDAFELAPGEDIKTALEVFDEISVRYQPAADGAPLLFHHLRADIET